MALCYREQKYPALSYSESLPGKRGRGHSKGTPLFACRASYTVEAAVIIPLVTIVLMTILLWFRVLEVQTDLQLALTSAGRECAVTSSVSEGEGIPSQLAAVGIANVLFQKKIENSDAISRYVANGSSGVSLLGSKVDGDYLVLRASCHIRIPCNIFGLDEIKLLVCSKNRRWTGRNEKIEDPVVYYTPYGKVYHRSRSCPYLDLSIQCVDYASLNAKRNKDGGIYSSCAECAAGVTTAERVFITDYGSAYHIRLGCSGLKRTIYSALLSQVGSRPACSKCKSQGE